MAGWVNMCHWVCTIRVSIYSALAKRAHAIRAIKTLEYRVKSTVAITQQIMMCDGFGPFAIKTDGRY